MSLLQLVVGPEARYQIEHHGLASGLFDKWIAASGGPKWLPLAPLERHLIEHFIPAQQPMTFMGTSSGAWRCAALCHPDPVNAHQRLQQGYIGQWYEVQPSPEEVEQQCRALLSQAFAEADRAAMLAHSHRHLNLIVCHGRGLVASDKRAVVAAGAAMSSLLNLFGRRNLAAFWRRWVLHAKADTPFAGMTDLPSSNTQLTANGLLDALLASGSIPMVLRGVKDLPNTEPGYYYDGGVTDYHLDLPALQHGGLTLYPHFYANAAPGWFDKALPWRRASANFRKVAMLVPSPQFVARLPGGKLPDRSDFAQWSNQQRTDNWHRAVDMGHELVEAFTQLQQDPQRGMVSLGQA
ncbi:patatin-like phospholipase family protein [uncultured Ferrimonas sp.]|uniref:patatin-like phospholipase family protein n=1 Tax=uncultured Ferrimonas sp. TaxID=432640 RepID=UPI0026144C2E|nr:patatin-like phospholipase family protein [uncultured Ferrimonas sp.]